MNQRKTVTEEITMVQIEDKLISFDIFEKQFFCDLPKCLGTCCVHGQSGAPLELQEIELLKQELENIKPFLKPEGLKAIEEQGVAVVDFDGDMVTPLIEQEECAFSIEKGDITLCAIEEAWQQGKVQFRKPISCHLYPIRVTKYPTFSALNYDRWSVCEPARVLGKKEGVLVFRFLKEAIIRAYGESFYAEMEDAYAHIQAQIQE